MRMQADQIQVIHSCLRKFFQTTPYELYLYGSRVHDELRGGDIDLVILTEQSGVELFEKLYLDILVEIKKQKPIGDRRIDIKAITSMTLQSHPFFRSIHESMVRI